MPRFPLIHETEAPDEVTEIYRDFRREMRFPDVPNFIRTQGASHSMLAGTWGLLKHVLLEGRLPRPTKELIFVAISVKRECRYCAEAHAACCRVLGVEDSTIRAVMEGLKGDVPDLPDHTRDILRFAIKCGATPENLNNDDFASLTRHGLDNEQVLEVIATAAMAVYSTIIADATMLDVDDMFAEM
ncbi:Carboxymuconolactone decarboxylase family protein [Stieleria neptunia]|uniref:Carboxymuconolactone decarboxylase family protein n=1 Tax=Stieleria neptunia TaxID=2527979 RepID=A0A518HPQ0_9BACT|nr:peroxidase-related enzyme [Stieleria neptunia]QDV42819.1 Carboxymuconolactone decarboxylase family protein [Stieleria neptunia]